MVNKLQVADSWGCDKSIFAASVRCAVLNADNTETWPIAAQYEVCMNLFMETPAAASVQRSSGAVAGDIVFMQRGSVYK